MKANVKKVLLFLWKVIKFIVTIGKEHEDKYLTKNKGE